MKLKETNGKIKFIMVAGKDFVRNEMDVSAANKIINAGVEVDHENKQFEGFSLCVDGQYYFETTREKQKKGE